MNFTIVRGLLSKDECAKRKTLMDKSIGSAYEVPESIRQCKLSPSFYGLHTDISDIILEKFNTLTDKNLEFTFDFCRIYAQGETLPRHIDRPACEYSVTINFFNETMPWDIFMEIDGKRTYVSLNPGDAVFYKGQEVAHGRHKNLGGKVYQGFFHYVDLNGVNYSYKNEYIRVKPITYRNQLKSIFKEK